VVRTELNRGNERGIQMSERSVLLERVLQIWSYSDEGTTYLEWLLDPEAVGLDGGAVLREAVLNLMEDDEQLRKLRRLREETSLDELCAKLPTDIAAGLRQSGSGLREACMQRDNGIREQAKHLRKIRLALDISRLEALKFVLQLTDNITIQDEIIGFLKNHDLAEEIAAMLSALSRTSAKAMDIETEWRANSTAEPWTDAVKGMANNPGEDWFDYHREKFDRYYSQQVVSKLDGIIVRVAALEPVGLDVKNVLISRLFREAHEAFLYGFDYASIALCRSLVEHALIDRLPIPDCKLYKRINYAYDRKILDDKSRDSATVVQRAGNEIMHDASNVRNTAQEVLSNTRVVLNRLYE
jgi:Domain of unknown function (DUF4145)